MKQFFKFMFASILGFFIAGFILFLVLVGFISSLATREKKVVKVTANSILKIELKSHLTERSSENPFVNFEPGKSFSVNRPLGLFDIIMNIRKARKDHNINGILLHFDMGFSSGFGAMTELRAELDSFRSSGKFVYSYADYYTDNNYFLASVADKIYISSSGEILLNGLNSSVVFYKRALDKLGVEMQVFRHGNFKGAVEPFMLEKLSDNNRAQIQSYLDGLYDVYSNYSSASRKISSTDFKGMLSNLKIQNADDAVTLKIIDGRVTQTQMDAILKEKSKTASGEELNIVTLEKYAEVNDPDAPKITSDKIAVLHIDGEIVDGEGDGEVSGADNIIKAIRQIKKDTKIKAVVLRVNSPGGSAAASDKIYNELRELARVKPLIASFGNVAASGGYYIAMAADTVYTMPNTITGSIGVFGVYPNLQNLLNDKLGITMDVVKTGNYSDFGRVDRPLTADEAAIIQNAVERIYKDFVGVVCDGRKLDTASVHAIAEGRVWTGRQAIERKLADLEGGLMSAIKTAASSAGMSEYRIAHFPVEKNPLEELISELTGKGAEEAKLKQYLGSHYEVFKKLQEAQKMRGQKMIFPYILDIN